MITAKKIENIVMTGAAHVRYRRDGGWYHHLKKFPGALFDYHGYVIFETKEQYEGTAALIRRQDLNVKNGISTLSGYKKFTTEEIKQIKSIERDSAIPKKNLQKIVQLDLDSTEYENSNDFEGGAKKKLVSYHERNPKLRAKAIQFHGTTCIVCRFDFKKNYGLHGEDYIEVHHKVPIHTFDKSNKVNPETDMVVICANCHRMIHRKKYSPLSIEELIELRKKALKDW